ncbi:MAG: hypothetical protein QM648_05705 [Solirubrobacterales bacterium]
MTRLSLRPALIVCALAASVLMFVAPSSRAAWGDLDTSFAAPTGYTNYLAPGNTYGIIRRSLIQPDGKIIRAGLGGADFGVATGMIQRLLPDGTPDPSFGTNGQVLLDSPAALSGTSITGIALQPDGSIVGVAWKIAAGSRLFRLTPSGALDTSFASPNGYLTFSNEAPEDVMIDSAGKIYTAANGTSNNIVLRAFTSSGVQIGAFASNAAAGLASTTFYGYSRILLRASGSDIFVLGTSQPAATPVFFAAKLDSAGNLLSGWGSGGKSTVGFSIGAKVEGAVVQPSGALVLAGTTENMGDTSWTFARFNAAGSLDPSFTGNGKFEIDAAPGLPEGATDLISLTDGTLVAAGNEAQPSDIDAATVRVMDANGGPISTFGVGGVSRQLLSGTLHIATISAQSNGRLLTSGYYMTQPGNVTVPYTARLDDSTLAAPTAKISTPTKSKIAAKKLTKFTGSASTNDGAVTKVEIALQRVDSKLLKKKKQCLWLSSNKAKFKKVKAVQKKCAAPKWLSATGRSKWSYKLKKRLAKGNYKLSVRVTVVDGSATTVQAKPTTKKFKVT